MAEAEVVVVNAAASTVPAVRFGLSPNTSSSSPTLAGACLVQGMVQSDPSSINVLVLEKISREAVQAFQAHGFTVRQEVARNPVCGEVCEGGGQP
jgi:hypothetical protein